MGQSWKGKRRHRVGRPAGKRPVIATRVSPKVYQVLIKTAKAEQVSISHVVERQLEHVNIISQERQNLHNTLVAIAGAPLESKVETMRQALDTLVQICHGGGSLHA